MAGDKFAVESADGTTIWISHRSHRFCFAIVDRKLEGALGAEANLREFNLRRRARSFAEREARLRGLID
jgi:hypothetical protein